jgi:hypothetical protein
MGEDTGQTTRYTIQVAYATARLDILKHSVRVFAVIWNVFRPHFCRMGISSAGTCWILLGSHELGAIRNRESWGRCVLER